MFMSIQRKLIGLLLKGYETGYPFVKELLQNADDAGASKLSLSIFDPPDKLKKCHPLFGTKILSITS